jgi:RNA polymerase sigma factor (sigma-70 family)
MLDSGLINRPRWKDRTLGRSRRVLNSPPSTKQKWTLTPEAFDGLLAWLDPDRERAGERYEEIRSMLVKGFRKHGCAIPEELADETINRVARKLPEIVATYEGDPRRYFYGVAHNVHMEHLRRPEAVPLPSTDLPAQGAPATFEESDDDEREHECLRRCIDLLTPLHREIILQYYRGERQFKIRLRKQLAEKLGIRSDNLRLRAQRIRAILKKCVLDCLGQKLLRGTYPVTGREPFAADSSYSPGKP